MRASRWSHAASANRVAWAEPHGAANVFHVEGLVGLQDDDQAVGNLADAADEVAPHRGAKVRRRLNSVGTDLDDLAHGVGEQAEFDPFAGPAFRPSAVLL